MKIAVITGSSGNIGREFTKCLTGRGYFVYALDKRKSSLRSNEKVEPVAIDVTDEDAVVDFFSGLNNLDLLVNNAGIGVFTPFEERTAQEFREVLEVNLVGTFLMAREAIKIMKKQKKGKIVNIGSIYGVKSSDERIYGESGRNNSEVYSASKAGVIQLTRYLACHYARYNIQVNCISPGGIRAGQSADFVLNYEYKTPAGRMGQPADISAALAFLCSAGADYINGQNIIVDGGFVAW